MGEITMKKKAYMFLTFSMLVAIYLLYGIFSIIKHIGSYGILSYVIVIIFYVLLIKLDIFLFKKYKLYSSSEYLQKEQSKKLERENVKIKQAQSTAGFKEKKEVLGLEINAYAKHVAGLPAAEGVLFYLYLGKDKVIFERNEITYNLSFDKIRDVTIKTDIEIQKAYVSSIGGAVGGAVLFGPLGAMIGGRAKQKENKTINNYLIFTYDKDNNIDFITFDVTGIFKAQKFVEFFRKMPKESREIDL
jgi:hypothetical protein